MLGESPLVWLDEMEKDCQLSMRKTFAKEIDLFERQVNVISSYVSEIGKSKRGTHLTIGELERSPDEGLLRSMVPVFLIFQAMDNLQAARLNILHGYFSVANACLRNVVEALRWAKTAVESAEVAREWLRDVKYTKPKNFVLAPPVRELVKLFARLSTGGSHPLATARTYSAWAKSEASRFLGDELRVRGIRSFLGLTNQISANFLFFLVGQFNQVSQENPLLQGEVNELVRDLHTVFGIKFLT